MFPAYLREAGYYTTNKQKKDYNAIEGEGVWDASSKKATWRNRNEGQSFFHMQSFGTSHESSLHFSRKQMESQRTETDPDSVFVAPYHPDTATFRYTYARYHDRIREVDQQIGQVVDQLKSDGLLEDTFVFYFGDHGGVLPRGKGYAYESGLHVPLVVRVPEKWKHLVDAEIGSRIAGFVSFVDFGPTLLTLAGLEVPRQVNGQPFLGDRSPAFGIRPDEAFGYADRFDEKYDLVRTLRKGKFEYVRNYQPFNFDGLQNNYRYRMLAYTEWRELYHAGKLNEVQAQFFEPRAAEALYNIERDPHETKNLARDPDYSHVLLDMRRQLSQRMKRLPDLSLYPENYLYEHAFENPTKFGQDRVAEIGELVDIADLSLLGFEKARPRIERALNSNNPWHRYWALIVCSSYGKQASPFFDRAKRIADDDSELMVRTRAAEFLGLSESADPRPTLLDVLAKTRSGVEAGLILNSVVLLRDGKPGYEFTIKEEDLANLKDVKADAVNRRFEYLNGATTRR